MSDLPKLTATAIQTGGQYHTWTVWKVEGFNNLYLAENPGKTTGDLCAYDDRSLLFRLGDRPDLSPESFPESSDGHNYGHRISGGSYYNANGKDYGNGTREELLKALAPYAQ